MVFDSPLLDVAISLIFIYLLVALMVTGVTEIIFTFDKTKSKLLKKAILHLFYDTEWKSISGEIIESPFLQALKRKPDGFPAFIPPKVFVSALLDFITDGKPTIDAINAFLDKNKTGAFSRWLKMELAQCDQNIETLKKNLELLFDNAMDRVTGWYTRKAKLWSLCIAFVICAGMNIDSIQIVDFFFNHPDEATKVADSGTQFAKNTQLDTLAIIAGKDTLMSYRLSSIKKSTAKADTSLLKTATIKLQQQPIPIGWKKFKIEKEKSAIYQCKVWFLKLLGLLASAAAASLGAPFWFDLLQKLTPLRKKQTEAAPAK